MSEQKYRQHGYMDRDRERTENKPKAPPKEMNFGPRSIQMAPTRALSRCAQCGVILNALVDVAGQCPQCGAALHVCKQCSHFDPGSRFECRQPVTGRVAKKDLRNDCTFFVLSTRVERETSASTTRTNDARRAFENLFKK
jgi:predicted RNA-binding Zn-ribbon protein involved in translation (DUF1610 family)